MVGLALIEERCRGLLDHLDAYFARVSATTENALRRSSDRPWPAQDITAALSWLERAHAVTICDGPTRSGTGTYRAAESLPDILRGARIAAAAVSALRDRPRLEDQPSLAVSWPHLLPPLRSARWRSSRMAIIDLLDVAETRVTMLFPFVDSEGTAEIRSALERSLRRGVAVTLVTRYLDDPQSPNSRLVHDLRSVPGVTERLLRTLQLVVGAEIEQRREILHAKVVVVDGGRRGYIGSANLTGTAMDDSLEIGVIVGGLAAATLGLLLDEIVAVTESL